MERQEHKQLKVILVGDGSVGKTSIANRFAGDGFSKSYKQTIGVDFCLKQIVLDDTLVTLQIWDIGGQSIGSRMLKKYIAGAHAVMMCYDMTNYDSFADLQDWLRLVEDAFRGEDGTAKLPFTGVIANKCDLSHMRMVKSQLHTQFVDENKFYGYTMSAKSGDQVDGCFHHVATVLSGKTPDKARPAVAVKATIVEHARHDPRVYDGKLPPLRNSSSKSRCALS